MARLYDGNKTVEITMEGKNGIDWSNDFFEISGLPYDDERDAYIVVDVDYCIDQAMDCQNGVGDYIDCEPNETEVYVEELQEA